NRHFVNAPLRPALGDFGGYFRFEAEAIRFQIEALQDFSAENFIASLHIGEVEVGEHIRKRRQNTVGDRGPIVKDAMIVANEARTENDIGTTVENGLNEPRILGGIVFEVGVLDDDDVTGRFLEAAPKGGAFALICFLINDLMAALREFLEHV